MQNIPSNHGNVRSADLAIWLRESAPDNGEQVRFLRRSLHRALREELTPTQARYITMYYMEGMNTTEIGRAVGVSRHTVSRTIQRGRARLRHVLNYSLEFPVDV